MSNFYNIKWDTIEFTPFTANPKQPGFKSCRPKSTLTIQLPASKLPFALSEPNVERSITKYKLPIAIGGGEGATKLQNDCLAKFEEFDEFLPKYASEHAQDFFGTKKKSIDVCKELMNPMVKVDQDPEKAAKYGARISPEVKHSDDHGFYSIDCRDTDGSPMSPMDIKRGSHGYVTIELASLYSVSGKAFGATWVVRAVRITQHAATEAPPISLDMYGDCPPELEAAMHAVLNDYEKREREDADATKKTADEEAKPNPAKKAKK